MAEPWANLNPVPDFSIRRIICAAGRGVDDSALNHGNNSESGRIEAMTSRVFAADFIVLSMVKLGRVTLCFGGKAAWFRKIMFGAVLS